jgi:hypothetical protein
MWPWSKFRQLRQEARAAPMISEQDSVATLGIWKVVEDLTRRVKAIEDSDTNLNQEAAKAIIDLQTRVKNLEEKLK